MQTQYNHLFLKRNSVCFIFCGFLDTSSEPITHFSDHNINVMHIRTFVSYNSWTATYYIVLEKN